MKRFLVSSRCETEFEKLRWESYMKACCVKSDDLLLIIVKIVKRKKKKKIQTVAGEQSNVSCVR